VHPGLKAAPSLVLTPTLGHGRQGGSARPTLSGRSDTGSRTLRSRSHRLPSPAFASTIDPDIAGLGRELGSSWVRTRREPSPRPGGEKAGIRCAATHSDTSSTGLAWPAL